MNKTIHQDVYTCEAANSLSNGQPLIHTINLVVKGNWLLLCMHFVLGLFLYLTEVKYSIEKLEEPAQSISFLAALHIQLLYVYLCTRASALKLNSMGLKQQVMDSTVLYFSSVPPRWTKGLPPRKSDVIIGRNETIDCTVTADPEAAIAWFKNGQPLQSSR